MKGFKKAFTIVELVIVIAVIAILAAVLIPTFSNIIRKANISNDTQLVRNLNTALVVDRAVNGEHKTMQSALDAAFDAGYDLAKINARANQNEILWDSKNDVFCYYNDDTKEIEYIPEFPGHDPVGQNEQYLFWKIYSATPEAQKYSIYWNSNSNFTPSLKVGFDAGKSTGVTSLNYVGSGSAQDVVIRTNSFDTTLTINAPKDTVKHYGEAEKVDVVAIANASYHENGTVQLIAVKEGHVKLEGDADVNGVYVYTDNASAGFEDIKITVDEGVRIPTLSRSAVVVQDGGTKVCTVVTDQAKDIYLFNEGIYEQIKAIDHIDSADYQTESAYETAVATALAASAWVNETDSGASANTQTAAQQLANEWNGAVAPTWSDENNTTRELANIENLEEALGVQAGATAEEIAQAITNNVDSTGTSLTEAENAAALWGTGRSWDPYIVSNTKQWKILMTLSLTGEIASGKKYVYNYKLYNDDIDDLLYIELANDLDFADVDLSDEYTYHYWYGLHFDGKGHTLRNACANIFGKGAYFFDDGTEIKDVIFENCVSLNLIGTSLGDDADVLVQNVTAINCTATNGGLFFAANFYNTGSKNAPYDVLTIKNCTAINCTVNDNSGGWGCVGGFVGNNGNKMTYIENCTFGGLVETTSSSSGVGGILGTVSSGSNHSTIKDCTIATGTIIRHKGTQGNAGAFACQTYADSYSSGNVFYGVVTCPTKAKVLGGCGSTASADSIWIKYNSAVSSDVFSIDYTTGKITYTGTSDIAKVVVEQNKSVDSINNSQIGLGGYPRTFETVNAENVSTDTVISYTVCNDFVQVMNAEDVSKAAYATSDSSLLSDSLVGGYCINNGKLVYDARWTDGNGYVVSGTWGKTAPNISVAIILTAYDANDNAIGSISFSYRVK